jgi:hypothetical protein
MKQTRGLLPDFKTHRDILKQKAVFILRTFASGQIGDIEKIKPLKEHIGMKLRKRNFLGAVAERLKLPNEKQVTRNTCREAK